MRTFAAWIAETFWHDKLFAGTLRVAKSKPLTDYWKLIAERNAYTERFYETVRSSLSPRAHRHNKYQVLDKNGFDGIIAPVQALPQLPHG